MNSFILTATNKIDIFTLTNPSTGTNDLVFTWTTTPTVAITVSGQCFANVDQSTPAPQSAQATATSTTPSVTAQTTPIGSIAFAVGDADSNSAITTFTADTSSQLDYSVTNGSSATNTRHNSFAIIKNLSPGNMVMNGTLSNSLLWEFTTFFLNPDAGVTPDNTFLDYFNFQTYLIVLIAALLLFVHSLMAVHTMSKH